MVREGGVLSLWAGLGPLLLREMLFSLPKFLVFQSGSAFLLARFPGIADTPTNADDLLVSLVAGAAAGVAGAIVSSPADALLTKQSSGGSGGGGASKQSGSSATSAPSFQPFAEGATESDDQGFDLSTVFAGAGVRCIFFAASISVQFLLYDYFRVLLRVSPSDLTEGLDVFADRLSFYNY